MPLSPIFILGPTGSGKSALAIELAERLGDAEIVSADAYQVYRQLPILTAAPTPAQLARIPHHLIATLDVSELNDAATHARRAARVIAAIQARGHRPIVTGGSGLYVKFISHGISPAPPSDPALRATLAALPLSDAVARLRELDPIGAAHTDLSNPRYVIRNLEIVLLGRRPLAFWQQNWQRPPAGPGFLLSLPTPELDARIAARAHAMLAAGVIDEVAALGPLSPTAEKTLGLLEIRAHLNGSLPRPQLAQALALTTRRYAKRQRTWLRRESWLTPLPPSPHPLTHILDALAQG